MLPLILSIFAFGIGILPLRLRHRWNILIFAALFLIFAQAKLLHVWLAGVTFPVWLIVLADCAFGAAFLATGCLCIEAAVAALIAFWRRDWRRDWRLLMRPRWRLKLAVLAVSLTASVYGAVASRSAPRWRTVRIELPGLPAAASGSRYVVLSDLHFDRYSSEPRMRELFGLVREANPDGIFILGDFIDGTVASLKERIGIFAELRAPQGVYGVLGNHEYYWGFAEWAAALEEQGVTMLQNESVTLPNGVILAGLKCGDYKQFPGEGPVISSKWACQGAPVILLSHFPELAVYAARAGVSLQLSGHTHGGLMPGLASLVALKCRGFVSGGYRVDDMPLIVSNGTGNWHSLPLRIGIPAEVIILELTAPSAVE